MRPRRCSRILRLERSDHLEPIAERIAGLETFIPLYRHALEHNATRTLELGSPCLEIGDLVRQVRFRRVAIYTILERDVNFLTHQFQPEPASRFEGVGFRNLAQPEYTAIERSSFRLEVQWNRDLDVVKALDHVSF
jgi:hypothetical protein